MRGLRDVADAHRAEEFTLHGGVASHVVHFDFIATAGDADVAGNLVNAGVAFRELGGYVGGDVVDFDIAGLRGDAYCTGQSGDGDVTVMRIGSERDALGQGDVEVHRDAAAVRFLIYGMNAVAVTGLFDHHFQRF